MSDAAFLPLDYLIALEPLARARGVSKVARSDRGFLTAYKKAKGKVANLSDYWIRRRQGFIARHLAQVEKRGEPLWKDGLPTRRHLALITWAFSPTPNQVKELLRRASRELTRGPS